MLSDPKNYFGCISDEFTELDCRAFSLYELVTGSLISQIIDALHELGKFVLRKTEMIFIIAWHF